MAKTPAVEELKSFLTDAKKAAQEREVVPIHQWKKKRLRPRYEWVLIRKTEGKDKITDAGVVVTEGQQRSQIGEVVEVSNKVLDLKPGDLVIFTNFPIELEDMEMLTGDPKLNLVRDEEVYAVIEDAEEA